MRRFFRSAAFPILIVIVLAFFAQRLISPNDPEESPTYSDFRAQVDERPSSTESVTVQQKDDTLEVKGTSGGDILSLLTYILPFALFLGFWLFLMNQMQGGGSRVMSFGKSKAKRMSVDAPKITFRDVAGADEAVQELHEIKEFLENPKKFQSLGARIPKGVLLYGPPGTGKTLLARAVAGEAGVPFFSISGSDFVEMFVGVGAARVRDLFEQAKSNAPAIVFIDEIDAVGRHRGAGLGGGHDEREQTLNQLLVEMDGFDTKTGVILMAATNRPDLVGRRGILKVHARGKPLDPKVDLDVVARRTPGFTGADLANVLNEAALLSARGGKRTIEMREFEEAVDRVMAGPERKTRLISDRVAFEIDSEVRRLIDEAHDGALDILQSERDTLDRIAAALIEHETVEKDDLVRLLEPVTKRAPKEGTQAQGAGIAVFRRSVRAPKEPPGESLR